MADTDEPRPDNTEQPAPEAEAADTPAATAPEVPENLAELPEEQLRELYATITAQIEERAAEAKTPTDVEAINQLRELAERIFAEVTRRREEEVQVSEALANLRDNPLAPLPDAPAPEAKADDSEKEPAKELVNASAAQLAAARERSDGPDAPPEMTNRPHAVLLAAAGAENVPTGAPIDWQAIGVAFDRIKDKAGGDAILASIPSFAEQPELYPELLTKDNGAEYNTRLMEQAQADWRALVSGTQPARQGAICEPFDVLRDIPDDFQTSEPVRGIFPSRPMGRMGWEYIPSIDLSAIDDGVSMWFEANQAAVDPANSATWKPCVEVTCPTTQTAVAEAVTACLTFDITTEMSQPERVRNFNNALMALLARTKEGRILQRIDALSHSYQFFPDYGALPGVVEALNTVLAQLTFANRTSAGRYVLIVPPGVQEVLTIDRANKNFLDETGTPGDVLAYLRGSVSGIGGVVESMDMSLGGEPSLPFAALTPITDPPTPVTVPYLSGGVFRFRLVAPDDALYAETGQINVGITRDSQLIRQNRSQFFVEEFFTLAKNGPSPWATVDIKLCADGGRAGMYDPHACATS